MSAQGPDRRILRAFYTQYVAVLLIVLVFFVAAFQAASSASAPQVSQAPAMPRAEFFGDIILSDKIITDGIASTDERALRAIAEVLRNHDVGATVELTVPRLALGEMNNGAMRAVTLTDHIDQFLVRNGAPSGVVRYVIRANRVARDAGGVVRIHWQEGQRE